MAIPPLHLYYFPASSASQKALLVLEEAGLPYSGTVINLSQAENLSPWYLRINPAGQVPALKVGDKYITDSEDIYDVVAELTKGKSKILPDPATPQGQLVQHWRKRVWSDINFYLITYGTLVNPQLADGELQFPPAYRMTKDKLRVKMAKNASNLELAKLKNPDLKEVIDKKLEQLSREMDTDSLTEENIKAELAKLTPLFDKIETQLRKSRTENILEHWLCGPDFTVCDMSLIMLIERLALLTYFDRFVNAERPAVMEYWAAACRRPKVQKIVLNSRSNMQKYFVTQMVKKVAVRSVAAIGVVALGVILAQKYRS